MAGVRQESLEGCKTEKWFIEEYLGKSKYRCRCLVCNAEKEIDSYSLKNSGGPKCTACTGKSAKGRIDLTGKQFGQWKVLEYAGDRKWKCQCSCGVIKAVSGSDLRNGKSTNCGHLTNRRLEDLTGKKFGEWEVLSKGETGENGETRWLCKCSCGKQSLITAYALKSGSSKSCGHSTTGFQDLTGQQFGNWKVLHKSDIQMQGGSTMWTCECQCKNHTIRDISSYDLRYGISKSCGCLRVRNYKNRLRQTDLVITMNTNERNAYDIIKILQSL